MKAFVRISAHDKTLTAVEFVNERGKVVLLVESRRTGDPEAPYTAEKTRTRCNARTCSRPTLWNTPGDDLTPKRLEDVVAGAVRVARTLSGETEEGLRRAREAER
jgi:hypothetical protein